MHALCEPFGLETRHLKQMFAPNVADADWINVLSDQGGWSVITHDRRNKGMEREILRRARLIVFFLDKAWVNHAYWTKLAIWLDGCRVSSKNQVTRREARVSGCLSISPAKAA
ncbi:hypothetical protein QCE63_11750 [Caballeronia sp. LZ065]|uniref:PIN-like domain-containing protein n=1 Tax=Caballeronia sp. LZ065 TaxID=3038571 RepID=UPI00286108A2|nr:hypothetical protein [Caballeronia sp. LZ065]MDR5780093.1 hypothetical protein [Caballeronia sp. LZ065]